jgi:hypothetical protein
MSNEFDLERAINGDQIETVSGTPAEFIAYRPTAKASKQVIVQDGDDVRMYYVNGRYHRNHTLSCSFDLRMKSVVKQIDWAKLPVNTLIIIRVNGATANHYYSSFSNDTVHYFRAGMTSKTADYKSDVFTINPSNAQIAPDNPWVVLLGGNCPIPDGLEFEYMTSNDPGRIITSTKSASEYIWTNYSLYAYRLTGKVLDGWTLFKNYNEMGWANE